jgi:hypothetical protein
METGLNRNQIVNELNRSAHGKLNEYSKVIGAACAQDPEFVAHLIAFDFVNGQIKDSKIALPVVSLAHREFPEELVENSLAHLAMAPPREILRALRFSIETSSPSRRQRRLEKTIRTYLAHRESEPGRWARMAARHRRSLKSLYALTHAPMAEWASNILFHGKYAPGSIFADIAMLGKMAPAQAAATIQKWHLSPLVVSGAMAGSKAGEDSSVVQATMEQMSDTEVVTRAKSLERKGAGRDAALKETFRKKVSKATKSSKATMKTGVAADEVEDEGLKTMLKELQERQIQAQKDSGRGIEGNWLVISDRSQSQEVAIKLGVHIAAAIAKFVTGTVHLVFCNTEPTPMNVTGKSMDQIMEQAKFIFASGSTSYGAALEWAESAKLDLDGVVIVGDGGENTAPFFAMEWRRYAKKHDKRVPVYLYQTYCDPRYAVSTGGNPKNFETVMNGRMPTAYGWRGDFSGEPVPFTAFDLTHGQIDYYSIPNLVQSMSANKFGVVEKIMACPLVTLEQVFGKLVAA